MLASIALLSDYSDIAGSAAMAGAMTVYYIVILAIAVLEIIGMWKMFVKAGLPGWYAIIPYFNMYWLFKISWGNGWLFLLYFVCGIGAIVLPIKLAPAYGKGVGYILGLIFLGPIFYIMLGFGDAQYQGPQ